MVPQPSIVDAFLHLLNLLVLFHKEVLCFASSLNIIGAWAEDKKGASCDLTLNGWGKRMLEMAASLGGRSCFV